MTLEIYATHRENKSQSRALVQVIDEVRGAKLPEVGDYEPMKFTDRGSTYCLSRAATGLYQKLRDCIERVVPGGKMVLNPMNVLTNKETQLVALSRSGATTETVIQSKNSSRRKTEGGLPTSISP